MMEDPRNITFCIHLMFCAKNIERMGDHATNIAETVYYMIEGRAIADERPKGDTTSVFFDGGEVGARADDASILIVEDEEALTLLLRYNLETQGYEVETIARGDEADTRLKEGTPISSSSIGCCPAFRGSSSAVGCARGRKRASCRSSC